MTPSEGYYLTNPFLLWSEDVCWFCSYQQSWGWTLLYISAHSSIVSLGQFLRNGIAKGNVHFKGFLIHHVKFPSFRAVSISHSTTRSPPPLLICSAQKYKVCEIVGQSQGRLALFLLWVMFKKRAVCDLRCLRPLGSSQESQRGPQCSDECQTLRLGWQGSQQVLITRSKICVSSLLVWIQILRPGVRAEGECSPTLCEGFQAKGTAGMLPLRALPVHEGDIPQDHVVHGAPSNSYLL